MERPARRLTHAPHWRAWAGFATLLGAAVGVVLLLGLQSKPRPPAKPVGRSQRLASCELRSATLMPVADPRALGYANNSRCLVDSGGTAWISVRSKRGGEFTICLVRAAPPWRTGMSATATWVEDRDSLQLSTEPQRVAAIAAGPNSTIHMVWYGGDASGAEHQVRYARFSAGSTPRIEEVLTPFRVPGFAPVAAVAATPMELWQEHPAIAVGRDGTTHVAWEARDAFRLSGSGVPRPGIAYATRSPDGVWSATGQLARPPYLQVNEAFPSQSRPAIVVDGAGVVHVVCYGTDGGEQQILHGTVTGRTFSGWKTVAPSLGDQRHVAAALDARGRLHVAWREGVTPPKDGRSGPSLAIFYSVRESDGRWREPKRLTTEDENASTPTVGVTESRVCVAWVAWDPGATNSEGKVDNGYPSDNSTVEGRIEVSSSALDGDEFEAATVIDRGPASYPCWAVGPSRGAARPALAWTSADPDGRVNLRLGWCER